LLEAADVRFGYSGRPDVIDGVTLRVAPGAVVGVLGPNGSGKTTLLGLMAGALRPVSGRVQLDGADVSHMPRRQVARRLAVVPQETTLAFDYTVIEIVLMGRYPHLGTFEVEGPADLAAARAALEATGTLGLADRPFRTLSGGEKQRVVIASALAQLDGAPGAAPALLLLDEPTASLDLRYQLEVAALLTRLHDARGITILVSTHDLRFAAAVCTSIVLLARGRVLAQGPPRDVLTPALVGQVFEVDERQAAPYCVSPA
jgi:iron complex transport system ATP-binding protein